MLRHEAIGRDLFRYRLKANHPEDSVASNKQLSQSEGLYQK